MFFSLLGSAALFYLEQLLETGVVADRLPNGIDFSASDVEKEEAPISNCSFGFCSWAFALNRNGNVAEWR
jgi:hypothetical protein